MVFFAHPMVPMPDTTVFISSTMVFGIEKTSRSSAVCAIESIGGCSFHISLRILASGSYNQPQDSLKKNQAASRSSLAGGTHA
jgi:hypothetical protein